MLVRMGCKNKSLILPLLVVQTDEEGWEGTLSSKRRAFGSKDFDSRYHLTSGTK